MPHREDANTRAAVRVDREALQLALLDTKDLPTFSPVAQELLNTLAADDASLDTIAHNVARAPELAARLVGLANSAYFGIRREIRSVEEAIPVLGLAVVRSLAVAIASQSALPTHTCPRYRPARYWLGSLLTALTAKRLLALCGGGNPQQEFAYLGGLLHRLGLPALVSLAPEAMNRVLTETARTPGRPLCALEEEQLGINHRTAGAWLMRRWHIPQALADVAARYGEAVEVTEEPPLYGVVGACSRWADTVLDGTPADDFQALPMVNTPESIRAGRDARAYALGEYDALCELAQLIAGADS